VTASLAPGDPSPTGPCEPAAVPTAVAAVLGTHNPADRVFTRLTHSQLTQATGGVWRVTGPSGSAVLKVCGSASPGAAGPEGGPPSGSDPRAWNHGLREPLAYRDGLPATAFAEAGITAPDLLASEARADGSFALWLQDVTGLPGPQWPVPRLGAFAEALGAAQAQWINRLPDRPWLSRSWLRQYVTAKHLPAEFRVVLEHLVRWSEQTLS
jgi:hypothetical protein